VTRPDVTVAVTRGAVRALRGLGYVALAEVTLPNARRADLMAISPRGELFIAEVKSSIEDYRVDRKWRDYLDFCDRFAFAVAPEFPQHVLPDDPGLLICDGFGVLLKHSSTPIARTFAASSVRSFISDPPAEPSETDRDTAGPPA
jgi:hypothetical protein